MALTASPAATMICPPVPSRTMIAEPRHTHLAQLNAALREYRTATRQMRRSLVANARLYHTLALRCPEGSDLRWVLENDAEECRARAARRSSLAPPPTNPAHAAAGDWLARGICRWASVNFAWDWLRRREKRVIHRVLAALDRLRNLARQSTHPLIVRRTRR
jgi:hypothetical protein